MTHHEAIAPGAPDLSAALLEAGLPIDDIGDPGRSFFRFSQDGKTVGFGGLEIHDNDALLRSVVVLPDARGRGVGTLITDTLLRQAFNEGARNVFLLTLSAAAFFEASGFKRVDRAAAPPAILSTRQASSICSSAPLLLRALEA